MEFEGRRRWLGLLAATLALPGCVSMGPRPEPRQALPADWDNRGEVAARTETPPRWWTAFEDAELDALAERALAGNLTLAQAAQRLRRRAPCRVPARPRPCRRSACTAPPSASTGCLVRTARTSCPAPKPGRANYRWRRKNGPSAITRPVSTPAGNSTCSAASPPPRTRRARAPAPPKPTCARPGCRWPPRPCAPTSNCAARSGAIRCCPACWTTSAICSPWCRSADARASPAISMWTAPACWKPKRPPSCRCRRNWRGSTRSVWRCLPERARSRRAAGVRRPALPRGEPTAPLPADIVRVRPDIRRAEQQVLQAAAELRVSIAELYPRLTLSGDIQITGNLTGKPLPGRSTMRRAGCPDPAAAGLGLATGRGRRARGRTGRGHPGLSAGRAGGRRGNRKRPGRLGGARTARAAIDAHLQASRRADAHAGLLYGRGMINLLERLNASVGHRQAELAAVEASEGRALAFVAVNKATGAVAYSVLARERMGCAHSWASAAGRVSSSGA